MQLFAVNLNFEKGHTKAYSVSAIFLSDTLVFGNDKALMYDW